MIVIRSGSGLSSTPRPNYVNPPTRGPGVQVTGILFTVLVTLSLVLRLYTRGQVKRQFGLDDLFAIFAMLLADASFVMQIVMTIVFHRNRHIWDIPPSYQYNMHKMAFVYNIVFAEGACQSKLSLLFFVHKMIGAAKHGSFYPHYICLLTLITIVALCQIMFVVLSCVECHPLKAAWDPHPTYPYKCFNTDIFLSIGGIINTLTDFLCTILPAFIVFKLHMPLHKRIGIASLFLVGIFVNTISALRIYYLYYAAETSDTWDMLPAAVCSNLELGLGLLCVNIPVIRPLITQCSRITMENMRKSISKNYINVTGTKYYQNAPDNSQLSTEFVPVDDRSKTATSVVEGNKTGAGTDEIEVLHAVEPNSASAVGSRKYTEKNRSDELPLQ